eukprot:4093827-Alexandrium_andersonii.AAC.1
MAATAATAVTAMMAVMETMVTMAMIANMAMMAMTTLISQMLLLAPDGVVQTDGGADNYASEDDGATEVL